MLRKNYNIKTLIYKLQIMNREVRIKEIIYPNSKGNKESIIYVIQQKRFLFWIALWLDVSVIYFKTASYEKRYTGGNLGEYDTLEEAKKNLDYFKSDGKRIENIFYYGK